MIHNNDNTNEQENQSNFEIVKDLLHIIWKSDLSKVEFRILLYQADQEFGYIKNGKIKNGDTHGNLFLTKKLGYGEKSKPDIIKHINGLVSRRILIKDDSGYISRYWINRNYDDWL